MDKEEAPDVSIKEKPQSMEDMMKKAMKMLETASRWQEAEKQGKIPMDRIEGLNPGVKDFVKNVNYPTEISCMIGNCEVKSYHFDTATVEPWFNAIMGINWKKINSKLNEYN